MRALPVLLACALLAACAPSRPGQAGTGTAGSRTAGPADDGAGIRFLLVYMIHGDGDYIWHDASGTRRLADEDALNQAMEVGRNSPAAEVFVFHQKPRRHQLLHASTDGTAYHFLRGSLVETRGYSRKAQGPDFAAEAALFRRMATPASLPRHACPAPAASAGSPEILAGDSVGAGSMPAAISASIAEEPVRFFIYFGHEIPAFGGRGYSRSQPREEFNLSHFARGIERFSGPPCTPAKPYALAVLSSCRGGTPATTAALFPYADWMIASPSELHLSFLDTRALIPLMSAAGSTETWRGEPRRIKVEAAAQRILRESFASLGSRTQTPVSLALYDAQRAAAYLEARPAAWSPDGELAPRVRMAPLAWHDCGDDPDFGSGGAKAGAEVLYRPGRFGTLKAKAGHSGWECPQGAVTGWMGAEPVGGEAVSSGEPAEEVTPEIPKTPAAVPETPPDPVPPS